MQGKTDDALEVSVTVLLSRSALPPPIAATWNWINAPASYISFIEPPLAQITQIALTTFP